MPLLRRGKAQVRRSSVSAAAGAAVMGTGIVSTALAKHGIAVLAHALLAVTAVLWLLLALVFLARLLSDRDTWASDAAGPASLTAVAATAVLGDGLSMLGWTPLGWALLGVAVALWFVLVPWVLRHRPLPRAGVSFLLTVATESLAVLGLRLAVSTGQAWLIGASGVFFATGLVLYFLVLARFDVRQLAVGAGDQWVAGGALAIASLAGAELISAAALLHPLGRLRLPLTVLDLILWLLALAVSLLLVASELRWPRPHYDTRRWATVFPVGMIAVASFAVARTERMDWIRTAAEVLTWAALAAWLVTAALAVACWSCRSSPASRS